MPARGKVIEVASGSGEHVSAFAKRFAGVTWQPSDPEAKARASIDAYAAELNAAAGPDGANLLPALHIDAMADNWWQAVEGPIAGVVSINMIHIAPWEACLGLMRGAGELLEAGGFLYLYGPYKVNGAHTAPSNEAFDESLRSRNLRWGLRDQGEVAEAAATEGLALGQVIPMPANNFSLVFRKG